MPEPAPRGLWRIVAGREIAVKLRDRPFLVSTLITVVLILAPLVVTGLLAGGGRTVEVAVLGADAERVTVLGAELARAEDENLTFTTIPVADVSGAEAAVSAGQAEVALVPDEQGWRLIGDAAENRDAATYLGTAAGQLAMQRNAAEAGVSIEDLSRGAQVRYDLLHADALDPGLTTVVGIVFAVLFYMASVLFGMSIAQSVVEEKQNRVVEILAASIPVRQLLIGKVAGNTALAMAQLVLFVAAGLIGMSFTGYGDALSVVGGAAGWFVVFFLVGFLALASLWAVAGSLATRSEDLQSTATPISVVIMLVLFAGVFLTGDLRTIASYVPVVSIVAMPARLAEGAAAWWEPLVALAAMAVTAYGVVVLAEKIYRRSLMQTQGRLTIRQALAVED